MRRHVNSVTVHGRLQWIRWAWFRGSEWYSLRCIHTPPGGFDEDLPNSFGKSGSDKGKGRGLSTVNIRIKNRLRKIKHKKKLLIPDTPRNESDSQQRKCELEKRSTINGNRDADSPKNDEFLGSAPLSPNAARLASVDEGGIFNDRENVVERERQFNQLYGVRPMTTVFGSDLDRLEEDYLRDFGQLGERLQEKRNKILSRSFLSKERGKRTTTAPTFSALQDSQSTFERFGGGRKGRRLRWTPSSSFDVLNEAELKKEGTKIEEEYDRMEDEDVHLLRMHADEGLPYDYGTLEEQRRRAKRDKHLTVGSNNNQNLSAHYMAAIALSEQAADNTNMKPTTVRQTEPVDFTSDKSCVLATSRIKNIRMRVKSGNDTHNAFYSPPSFGEGNESLTSTPVLDGTNQPIQSRFETSSGEEKKPPIVSLPSVMDQPAEMNPHFPSSFPVGEESKGYSNDSYSSNEDDENPLFISSSSSASYVPSFIRVDDSRPTPFLERRAEERFYASSTSAVAVSSQNSEINDNRFQSSSTTSSSVSSSTARRYNAYAPRPWEDSLPILRSANYWDENPEHRKELEEQLEHENKAFQQEQLIEGTVDTSEVEYSTQKLRKEMLLYYQAHPINEMITENYVRIREIHPVRYAIKTSSEKGGTDELAGTVLRYHPEALSYPTEWLSQQKIDEKSEEDAIALLKARDAEVHHRREVHEDATTHCSTGGMTLREEKSMEENMSKDTEFKTETVGNKINNRPVHSPKLEETNSLPTGALMSSLNAEVATSVPPESSYNDALETAVNWLYKDYDVPLSAARHLAARLGLDLIQISSLYTAKSDRRIIALCAIADHREHLRQMIRFKLQKLGVQSPPTMPCVEVPFKGGTHPHAVRVKAVGIAKRLLHRHVVRVQLTKFGTPREGFAVLQTILDEIRHQCEAVHAYHTAGKIQSSYHEIYCFLYPSTGKSPKSSVKHPSPEEIRSSRDLRILADEKEIYFDDFHNLPTHKARLRYAKKISDGTAWAEKDEGLSLQRQRAIKVMLGYLPKGNKEMYAARGDVNIPAPFRTSHPTGVDRWSSPPPFDNLEQANRGAAVLGKRAGMSISEMHDAQETEDQPSTLDRFYYRVQGSALEVGELKEALGLKENRKRGVPLGPGFATLSSQTKGGSSPGPKSTEDPHFTVH